MFVTFGTKHRWQLPQPARDIVMVHCLHDHGTRIWIHAAVVMPDHVHMVYGALRDAGGRMFPLAQIMQGIKGSSARNINRLLGRSGPVWQAESFDHVIRDGNLAETVNYLCQNPVRKGLAASPEQYGWVWRAWVEGDSPAGGGRCTG